MKNGIAVDVDLKKVFGPAPDHGIVPKVDAKKIITEKQEQADKKEVPRGTRKNAMIWVFDN